MEQRNEYMKKKRTQMVTTKTFFAENGILIDHYSDFNIRLEALLAKAVNKGKYIVKGVSLYWSEFFPEIEGNEALYDVIKNYAGIFRRSLFDIAKRVDITDEEYKYDIPMQRILVRYKFLIGILEGVFRAEEASEYLYDELFEIVENRRLVLDTVEQCIEEYLEEGSKEAFTEGARSVLEEQQEHFKEISERLEVDLRTRADKVSQQNIFTSKFNIVKIEDIMENAFIFQVENPQEGKRDFGELLEKYWSVGFGEKEFTGTMEKYVMKTIFGDEFLNALKVLNTAGNIKNIYKAFHATRLAYGYTLKYVMVKMGSCRDLDTIIDETMEMASRINFVSVSEEEESAIIEELISRYSTENNEIDEDILKHFVKRKNIIERMYTIIKDSFNNRYVSKTVEEKDKVIEELINQRDFAGNNVLKKLVECLTDANRGYILNNLYRFSCGCDEISTEMVRDNLNGLFYILGQFGITPAYEECLNQIFTETNELWNICKLDGKASQETYRVQYPGWKINGNLLIPPVSVSNEED